jgi:hypothetical protein
LFVVTLGYSRKCVRPLTFQSSTRIRAELHERAFCKLGGAVKIVVSDSLREGVLKPDMMLGTRKIGLCSDKGKSAKGTECAGINRHVVGDERALQERSSDSILTTSLAPVAARRQAKRR